MSSVKAEWLDELYPLLLLLCFMRRALAGLGEDEMREHNGVGTPEKLCVHARGDCPSLLRGLRSHEETNLMKPQAIEAELTLSEDDERRQKNCSNNTLHHLVSRRQHLQESIQPLVMISNG